MWRGGRSDLFLAGLALVAIANGLLLGLGLYTLLATAIAVVHGRPPSLAYGWLAGGLAALALLTISLRREKALREGEYRDWVPIESGSSEHPIVPRFERLLAASTLDRSPSLGWIPGPEMNAFTVGRSREDASIILTAGLIEQLPDREIDAVLAQQLAHIESEDVRAAGLADAIADSVSRLAQVKGRFLWGPGRIVADLRPLLVVTVAGAVVLALERGSGGETSATQLLFALVGLAILYAYWQAAKRSWRGLAQLFLFISFFGPLSLVEALLAPPTAIALARLSSRARVHEADARAVQLTGDPGGLVAALRRLANLELNPSAPWLGERRFSLFVSPGEDSGRWQWLARQRATHPSISSRLEAIRELEA